MIDDLFVYCYIFHSCVTVIRVMFNVLVFVLNTHRHAHIQTHTHTHEYTCS